MVYKAKADTVGELAEVFLKKHGNVGRVRILLNSSIYIDVAGNPVILTCRQERSPLTINIKTPDGCPLKSLIKNGLNTSFEVSNTLRVGELEVDLTHAEKYFCYSPTQRRILVSSETLLKCSFIISSFYQFLDNNFIKTPQLRSFIKNVVIPYSFGYTNVIFETRYFTSLIGLGGGFTPSGDDFLTGFLSTLNIYSPYTVILPRRDIFKFTRWASGMLLYSSQLGYYSENLSSVLNSLAREEELFDSLLSMIKSGHTSGVDTSLGVLVAASMLVEVEERDSVLKRVLGRLGIDQQF